MTITWPSHAQFIKSMYQINNLIARPSPQGPGKESQGCFLQYPSKGWTLELLPSIINKSHSLVPRLHGSATWPGKAAIMLVVKDASMYPAQHFETWIIVVWHRPLCDWLPSDIMYVTRSPRPSPSIFTQCKQSKTGGGNGLATTLPNTCKVLKTTTLTCPHLPLALILALILRLPACLYRHYPLHRWWHLCWHSNISNTVCTKRITLLINAFPATLHHIDVINFNMVYPAPYTCLSA